VTPVALTQAELDILKAFLEADNSHLPDGIRQIFDRLIALYLMLINTKKKASDILKTLRIAMGIEPSSERGKQLLTKC